MKKERKEKKRNLSDFRKPYKNKVSANYRFWGKCNGVQKQGFRTKAL